MKELSKEELESIVCKRECDRLYAIASEIYYLTFAKEEKRCYMYNGYMISSDDFHFGNIIVDVDNLYKKVYKKSYVEYVFEEEKKKIQKYLEMGFKIIPEDKHYDWVLFVKDYIDKAHYYTYYDYITDTVNKINQVNNIKTEEELKKMVVDLAAGEGSTHPKEYPMIIFSNKSERFNELYDEYKSKKKS